MIIIWNRVNYIKAFLKALNVSITETRHSVILLRSHLSLKMCTRHKVLCECVCVYMYLLMDAHEGSRNVSSHSL